VRRESRHISLSDFVSGTSSHFTCESSTSFGWGKGGKVTSAGWQVTLCDLIWHVISRSGVVISIMNCYIRFTLLTLLCLQNIVVQTQNCTILNPMSVKTSELKNSRVEIRNFKRNTLWCFHSCHSECGHSYSY